MRVDQVVSPKSITKSFGIKLSSKFSFCLCHALREFRKFGLMRTQLSASIARVNGFAISRYGRAFDSTEINYAVCASRFTSD